MKKKLFKWLWAFSIAITMILILPGMANGQKGEGKKPPSYCNCFVRPIPFKCGQICGFLTGKEPLNDPLSIAEAFPNAISLRLSDAQNVSLRIYDVTGRLIKTLANNRLLQGEYDIEWNRKDEAGNMVKAGLYTLQFDAGTYSSTKKLSVIN